MKYIRIIALICICAAALAGCFGNDQPQAETVGILTRDLMHDTIGEVRAEALQNNLTVAGYTVKLLDAKGDQSIQTEQLKTLLEEGCRGVVIDPVMASSAPEMLALAKDVPVVFTGKSVSADVLAQWDKAAFVGVDPEQPGVQQGNILINTPDCGDINGDGTLSYILVRDAQDYTDTQLQTAGMLTTLTEAEITLWQLGVCDGEGDRQKAREGCALLLAEYGKDIEAVICSGDTMALGALEAIEDGGRTVGEDIYLVGIGGSEEARKAIDEGTLTGTVREDTDALTQKVLGLLQQLESGTVEEKIYYVNCIAVYK